MEVTASQSPGNDAASDHDNGEVPPRHRPRYDSGLEMRQIGCQSPGGDAASDHNSDEVQSLRRPSYDSGLEMIGCQSPASDQHKGEVRSNSTSGDGGDEMAPLSQGCRVSAAVLRPPSVALMGRCGTGKSTVMEKLLNEHGTLSSSSKRSYTTHCFPKVIPGGKLQVIDTPG